MDTPVAEKRGFWHYPSREERLGFWKGIVLAAILVGLVAYRMGYGAGIAHMCLETAKASIGVLQCQ